MAQISLILPTRPDRLPPTDREIAPLRAALEDAGHAVEVVVVEGHPGLAMAAIEGLREADGEVLLVLDPGATYAPEDLARVAEPLAEGRADLAVAAIGPLRGPVAAITRLLTGTAAPRSGLVGLTRQALDGVRDDFRPAGDSFSFELLARVKGRWAEVPASEDARHPGRRPGLDDLRQWKRLADHRFGNASRLIQFCAVGGSGAVIDLSCYLAFQPIFERTALATWVVPPTKISGALAASRALAIGVALVWNFSLNRRLTFSYARSESRGRQFATYVLSNALGILLSLGLSLGLPRKVPFFQAHKLAAAVVGIVASTGVSFSMSRWLVFRRKDSAASPTPGRGASRSIGPRQAAVRPAARPLAGAVAGAEESR